VYTEICENWGYEHLHNAIRKRAIDEIEHAEKLVARIIFLQGEPIVSELNRISIGPAVERQHKNDRKGEEAAIKDYRADIRLAVELGDGSTRELLRSVLADQKNHIKNQR